MEIIIKVESDEEMKRAERFASLVSAKIVRYKQMSAEERQKALQEFFRFTEEHGLKYNGTPTQMPLREERNAR